MSVEDEKVTNALITLLESNIGYGIDLFGLLKLYQLEDLRFAVNRYEYKAGQQDFVWMYEEIFDSAREAVEFFEQKREEYELGFDIEAELNKRAGLI